MRALLIGLAAAALLIPAAPASALDIGEKPPDLDVTEWIQGDPVVLEQCAGKSIVVVDFWASYSDDCKKSIPRLSKLAEKYKGQGLEVVGISDEKADDIKAFAKDGKFKYHVACDADRNTAGPYTKGIHGKLPFAVVIDRTGVVVWQGNPLSGLERVVGQVLAGKFDAEKAKALAELQSKLEDSIGFHEDAEIATNADKLLDADPSNERALDAKLKGFEKGKDAKGCKAFVDKILPQIDEDAHALNLVAWQLATCGDFALRLPVAALKAARRAAELTEGADDAILDTLARVQFECGMLDEAIATQKKAAAIAGASEAIKAALAYYQACAEARKQPAK